MNIKSIYTFSSKYVFVLFKTGFRIVSGFGFDRFRYTSVFIDNETFSLFYKCVLACNQAAGVTHGMHKPTALTVY